MRLACLLLASLAAPTAATLTKINNVVPVLLGDSLDWGSIGLANQAIFPTPKGPLASTSVTQVSLTTETGGQNTFQIARQDITWLGGLDNNMFAIYNQGNDNIKLEFSNPISAFATYVDVSDQWYS
jgi:hypothetical protein